MTLQKTKTRKLFKVRYAVTVLTFVIGIISLSAQDLIKVDERGVMRWSSSNEELTGFGVNYTVPFAHAYRTAQRRNVNVKEAIDKDVYHFSRLGFDLYRVHVWDTQISDAKGNLIENEYLDAFDYLLARLSEKNINYVITPIAFWGNGWPEPDTPTPGFSYTYGKEACLTNEEAILAQENYLAQFLNHVNPYKKLSYKNDPNVIAFEVSNEPHHKGDAKDVTAFVKRMVNAIKKTGNKKPIFYNMSHGVHFVDAYFEGGVQGGTFQWYPTGLGYGKELSGNLLPNVDNYQIPFESNFKKYNGSKLVYEFDAADVGRSYIYPAMARSFRKAGIQIATHFAYDPTFMADVNTEYNTHYMNLAYTPQKALSLKICAEVFREVPLYKDFDHYPSNTSFGDFKVDYKTDLALYNTNEKFYYTNTTNEIPKNELSLTEVAGFGNSPIVNYDGLGAYFLDKIDQNLWRLEVMPDAVWIDNPFGRNSPDKTIGIVKWARHSMTLNLQELGESFEVQGINAGNSTKTRSEKGQFTVSPGTYMLYSPEAKVQWSEDDRFKQNKLSDFFAPKSNISAATLVHRSPEQVSNAADLILNLKYISEEAPDSIELIGIISGTNLKIPFEEIKPYHYALTLKKDQLEEGILNYYVVVQHGSNYTTYPANENGLPFDWDFFNREPYTIPVVSKGSPILLFNAKDDSNSLVRTWRRGLRFVPSWNAREGEYQIHLQKLFYEDSENLNAKPIYDYSFKHFVIDKIINRKDDLASTSELVVKGRSLLGESVSVQIALVLSDGSSYGGLVELLPKATQEYRIKLSDLNLVKTVLLPRPYPTFLPYYFQQDSQMPFNLRDVESVQFSIGPGLRENLQNSPVKIGISSLWLE